jgi:molecular chaperone GrpE
MKNDPQYVPDELETGARAKVDKVKKKLKQVEKERKEYLDGWQRERAEFANYKKDIEKYLTHSRAAIKEDVLTQFLPVMDNLELALKHTPDSIVKTSYHKGIEHIATQFTQLLSQCGIEELPVKPGDTFDPAQHEAVEGSGEKIAEVVQKGYTLNGVVLRAARVKTKKK